MVMWIDIAESDRVLESSSLRMAVYGYI